jgi:hypothetical protein
LLLPVSEPVRIKIINVGRARLRLGIRQSECGRKKPSHNIEVGNSTFSSDPSRAGKGPVE